MIIDVDTAKHVELLSSSAKLKAKTSLYGILNKCSTPGGSKLLRATLFQPPIQVHLQGAAYVFERLSEATVRPVLTFLKFF